jgi:hypothetical protein
VRLVHEGLPRPEISNHVTVGAAIQQEGDPSCLGGSTSVGCNAIQLATAAGYEVIATASPQNHELLRKLGAVQVFDYRSPTVVKDIVAVLKNRTVAGALAIGGGSLGACIDVVGASTGGRKFVAQATIDLPDGGFPKNPLGWPAFGLSMGYKMTSLRLKALSKGVSTNFIWGSNNMANEVGDAVYRDFLPEALAEGQFVAAPEPFVIGKGLEHVQKALNMNKDGVSAKKIVITL